LFGLINRAFVCKAVNAIKEYSERKESVMTKEIEYLQSSEVVLWFGDVFVEGGFGPLEMIETGSVDQETYINVLISRFHPWFTNVAVHQERDFIFQGDGASCHKSGRKPAKLGV
jgi:hypothetical protein